MHVKQGVREAGGTPLEFNTVSISDGITMGSEGMRASLVSREVIADSIELVTRGNLFDALVVLVGCDKTIPAAVMALARLDVPGLVLYGGSIAPGRFQNGGTSPSRTSSRRSARTPPGDVATPTSTTLERHACPGAGACGGQFTANTMATVCEILGISPLRQRAASRPIDDGKAAVGREAGALVIDVLRRGLRPRQILTRDAIENAIAAVAATGGSTNAVLHLLAIAREAGVAARHRRLRSDQRAGAARWPTSSPAAASSPPTCTAPAASRSSCSGCSRPACCTRTPITVTGRTIGEHAREAVETAGPGGRAARSRNPIKPTGGLVILNGNLAPDGASSRSPATTSRQFAGPARVFDGEEAAFAAVRCRRHPARRRRRRSATRVRAAARACARCWRSPPR